MKIAVIGLRGIPDVQGGIETHCQNLYPFIAKEGHDIYVFRRNRYNKATKGLKEWNGIHLIDLPAPHNKYFENITHSFMAIFKAKRLGADIVHIHGIGPALLAPLAKALGMKVVITHHGRNYYHKKWGALARKALKQGEKTGFKKSEAVICVSNDIKQSIIDPAVAAKTTFIPNGYSSFGTVDNLDYIEQLGLAGKPFLLTVGRLVEEKGYHDLIAAFKQASKLKDYHLVIAGDNDFNSLYTRQLVNEADERVIFTGRLPHEKIAQLYSQAKAFVLTSYHEGLPIVLLEAMSFNLPLIVSDIPANRLPEIPAHNFYPVGNVDQLTAKLEHLASGNGPVNYDLSNYRWNIIADKTLQVLNTAVQH